MRYYHGISKPSKKIQESLSGTILLPRLYQNGDSDDNDERDAITNNEHRILITKGMNCIPRYPVDYDYAHGMLVLYKAWSKDNSLNSILKDHQKPSTHFYP
jgi:hypothetical protein